MSLFDPPPLADEAERPVTWRRAGWSLSRGILLGMGLAALMFAFAWAPALVENQANPNEFISFLALSAAVTVFNWSMASQRAGRFGRTWVERMAAVTIGVVAFYFLIEPLISLRLTGWAQAHREFVTLVVVCGVVGLLAVRGGLRLWMRHRSRFILWLTAAVALWVSNDWAVRLGPAAEPWNDPRSNVAVWTVMLAGVLLMTSVLALMDWHIRQRSHPGEGQDGSQRDGLTNG